MPPSLFDNKSCTALQDLCGVMLKDALGASAYAAYHTHLTRGGALTFVHRPSTTSSPELILAYKLCSHVSALAIDCIALAPQHQPPVMMCNSRSPRIIKWAGLGLFCVVGPSFFKGPIAFLRSFLIIRNEVPEPRHRLSRPRFASSVLMPALLLSSSCIFRSKPSFLATNSPRADSSMAIRSAGVASLIAVTFWEESVIQKNRGATADGVVPACAPGEL